LNNVVILALAQMLTGSGLTVVVIIGGIVGAQLAPRPSLVTFPLSLAIVVIALTTVPAALIMRRIGRRNGFLLGALIGISGGLVTAHGISVSSFAVFCFGAVLLGGSTAFTQQYRFAAAESVPAERASHAISYVLIGGLGAAILGPQLALAGRWWLTNVEYAGSFHTVSLLYLIAFVVLTRLKLTAPVASEDISVVPASTRELVSQRTFRSAVLASAAAYAVMSFIMTAAPISMHLGHGYSVEATTLVIQSHVLAMYMPSLFSGHIIARFGERKTMLWGSAILAGCAAMSLAGQEVMHYWWALVLLGLGWNLLFVSGTTLLTKSLNECDRHRGQAINEFAVFGSQACASLLAGVAVQQVGWLALNLLTLPLLAAMVLAAWRLPVDLSAGRTRPPEVDEASQLE
jgi:MFS family permease